MTTSAREDLVLQALLTTRAETAPALDEELLQKCYAVQRRHQFSEDRSQSSAAMERLIDQAVAGAAERQV